MEMQRINEFEIGKRFSFKGFEWVALDFTEDGGVLAVMSKKWKDMPFDERKEHAFNNYFISSLHNTLREQLLPVLGKENLLQHYIDLVSDDGNKSYSGFYDKVFILSCDEYRKYRNLIPQADDFEWTCTPMYINPEIEINTFVRIRCNQGNFDNSYCKSVLGVRPACVFKLESNQTVSGDANPSDECSLEEIIKSLRKCCSNTCDGCPVTTKYHPKGVFCIDFLKQTAAEKLDEAQKRIDKLERSNNVLIKAQSMMEYRIAMMDIKMASVKRNAERFVERALKSKKRENGGKSNG